MEHLDPSALSHLGQALGEASQHALDSAGDKLGQSGAQGLVRVLSRAYARMRGRINSDEFSAHQDRLETALAVLIDDLERNGLTAAFSEESNEPAAARFVSDAVEDIISSPSEGKRALLGRMISRRLSVTTETYYELVLRDALRIAAGLNESQLTLLGTLLLLEATPLPASCLASGDAIAEFFHATYDPVLKRLSTASRTRSDVEKLIFDGALLEVNPDELRPSTRHYFRPRFNLPARALRRFWRTQ